MPPATGLALGLSRGVGRRGMRKLAAVMWLVCVWGAGCGVSRNVVDVKRPADLAPLEQLEREVDGVGPAATRPGQVQTP